MKVIHKIAAIVIQDNKLFMVRKVGKDIWTTLGGKIEAGETEEQCPLREIKEEINCDANLLFENQIIPVCTTIGLVSW